MFFLHHINDREWMYALMDKLTRPVMGFTMCCLQQSSNCRTALTHAVLYGIKHSQKTIVVISADFVCEMWLDDLEVPLLTDAEIKSVKNDLILVILQVKESHICIVLTLLYFSN